MKILKTIIPVLVLAGGIIFICNIFKESKAEEAIAVEKAEDVGIL